MQRFSRCLIYFPVALLIAVFSAFVACGQEDVYQIQYSDVFGDLRRPMVEFPHDLHIEALEDIGCGACHHAPDPDTGALVYMEDEETSCIECHGADSQGDTPALREAFHGSCTVCHRRIRKTEGASAGPTTCGECHIPE